jgi:hypothetical protein
MVQVTAHAYVLIPWNIVLLEQMTNSQLVKKLPTFYGTRMFIATFTSARHLSLCWSISVHSMPSYSTSWRVIIILSSLYNWVFQAVSFPQVSQLILCMHLSSPHTCYMPCPSHSSLHYVLKIRNWRFKYSRIWCRVDWLIVTDVSEERAASIFSGGL